MAKDWTGNGNSIYKTLGASNHTEKERVSNDFYATDPEAIKIWLNERNPILTNTILEPAAGNGHISETLKQNGYNVISCDLIQRDYPLYKTWDFLSLEEKQQNGYSIIMNPPYVKASEFIQKAIGISKPGTDIWAFLKLQFLEGKKRREDIFNKNWLREVDVYTSRVKCAANGDFDSVSGSAVCFAFFRFNNSETTEPIIKWIN